MISVSSACFETCYATILWQFCSWPQIWKMLDGNRSPVKTKMETPKLVAWYQNLDVASVCFYSISFWTMKFYAQVPHGYGYQGADRHLNHRPKPKPPWPELPWIYVYREPKPKTCRWGAKLLPKLPPSKTGRLVDLPLTVPFDHFLFHLGHCTHLSF